MTREDLLAELRDIHLPPTAGESAATEFAVWPFVVFGVITVAIIAVRMWARRAWRREARATLQRLNQTLKDDTQAHWSALLELATKVARKDQRARTLPQGSYLPPQQVSETDRQALITHIREAIR